MPDVWGPRLPGMAGGSRPAGVGLLERGGELASIEQAIGALRDGHGGVLVIEVLLGSARARCYGWCVSMPLGTGCRR